MKGKGKGAFDSVSIQAIYGAIDSYHSRETHTLGGRSCVTRLAISAEAHERALSLVQTKDRRPSPVDSDDDSNDSDEVGGGDAGDESVRPVMATSRGRRVADHGLLGTYRM